MKAIVYTSNAGHTKQYAELLGKRLDLPVYDLKSAAGSVPSGSDIIYMGWLCKAKIKGYSQARSRYKVKALCPVGMWPAYMHERYKVAGKNKSGDTPMYYLQGGLDNSKLHGFYMLFMAWMCNALIKRLNVMDHRTELEDELLVMVRDGKNYVSDENLNWIVKWYEEEYCGNAPTEE